MFCNRTGFVNVNLPCQPYFLFGKILEKVLNFIFQGEYFINWGKFYKVKNIYNKHLYFLGQKSRNQEVQVLQLVIFFNSFYKLGQILLKEKYYRLEKTLLSINITIINWIKTY